MFGKWTWKDGFGGNFDDTPTGDCDWDSASLLLQEEETGTLARDGTVHEEQSGGLQACDQL